MRVFELAQSLNIPAAEVLQHATALKFDATTALSRLSSAEVAKIQSCVQAKSTEGKRNTDEQRKTLDEKRTRAAAITQAAPGEREKLQAGVSRAQQAAASAPAKPKAKPAPVPAPAPQPVAEKPAPAAPAPVEKPVVAEPLPVPPKETDVAKEEPVSAEPQLDISAIIQPAAIPEEPAVKLVPAEKPEEDLDDDFEEDEEFDDEEDFSSYVRNKPAPKIEKQRVAERGEQPKGAKGAPKKPASATPPPKPAPAAIPGRLAAPAASRPGAPAPQGRPAPARPAAAPGQKPAIPGKKPLPATPPKPLTRSGFQPVSSAFNKPPAAPVPAPRPSAAAPQAARPPQAGRPQPGNKPQQPARPGFKGQQQSARPPVSPAAPAPTPAAAPSDRTIPLRGAVIIKDLAELMGMRPNKLIADLMQMNVLASINQRIELDHATRIAEKYGFKVELERQKRSGDRRPVLPNATADDEIPDDPPESLIPRPPIVTFLGHVDHGKTSLMDRIRDAKVAAGEAGGITQHIGAYTVDFNGKKITFLDTPGHAAFSSMRARGASMTDIAVIIIAADDGVMPQTREAIRHAKNANVQIMVAINKCDLPTAKPDRVKQMLQSEGLTPEEWGGDVVCCEVSAITGKGVDHLLEMLLIQADMLELTANPGRRADGFVIEAQLEQGRGPTATLLVDGGTLKVGDVVLIGENFGKIRGLVDDRGRMVKSAGPSMAVRCMGLSGVPEAGAHFRVMLNEKRARELADQFAQDRKLTELAANQKTTIDNLFSKIKEQQQLQLAAIVKADTQGSVEAICQSLRDIRSNKVSLTIVADAVGNISQADIQRAAAAGAHIVGFHVACEPGVQSQARHDGVRVNTFRIIYELLDHIRREMLKLIPAEYKEIIRGHADIRAIFNIGKKGKVAGCQMLDGTLRAADRVRVKRKNEVIYDGKFLTLQHFQDEVAEITSAQECGIRFTGFEAFETGDIVECYAMEELERTL